MAPEEKTRKRNNAVKIEIILVALSFMLPFIMALLYSLIADVTIEEVFNSSYRFAVLGGMLLFATNAIAVFYFFGHRDTENAVKEIAVISVAWALCFCLSTIFAAYISIYIVPICFVGFIIALLIDNKLALYVNTVCVSAFYFCYAS